MGNYLKTNMLSEVKYPGQTTRFPLNLTVFILSDAGLVSLHLTENDFNIYFS